MGDDDFCPICFYPTCKQSKLVSCTFFSLSCESMRRMCLCSGKGEGGLKKNVDVFLCVGDVGDGWCLSV